MKTGNPLFIIMMAGQIGIMTAAPSGGVTVSDEATLFKLKAPDAYRVEMILFDHYDDTTGNVFEMVNNGNGRFSLKISEDLTGKFYGFRVYNLSPETREFPEEVIIADPYSFAVATQNVQKPLAKSLIFRRDFNWEGDTWVNYNPRDLIIYEAHLKDMTAHPSSGAEYPGTYRGFIDRLQRGGIVHLKEMGYNAVEFLPLFEFANFELPYMDSTSVIMNTWNPYERNHWGYMPTFYFAPESQFASDGSDRYGDWNGYRGRQVTEFKKMVKELHKEGISVILDVVYNHVSQYDHQPLKQLQKKKYFRQNEDGNYSSVSGCGNDLKTENEDMRKMILESILYWMTEYHIDGFRFDLGKMLDWQTIELIRDEAKKLNPNVFITCEPWGGGYDPSGFSDRNWSSWNDQFRNGVKGSNPQNDPGFIFGKWSGDLYREPFLRFISGSLRDNGGQYLTPEHSVNYLESHDNYTLGDFIRIATGKVAVDDVISDIDKHAQLSADELKIHKLAALILLTSQGTVMIAEGQEWGRSKVIAKTDAPDPNVGKMDHNSYEKDNETNWLNWEHKEMNRELVNHYKQLISLRLRYPALRRTDLPDMDFDLPKNKMALGYHLHPPGETPLFICVNGSNLKDAVFFLPDGEWDILFPADTLIKNDDWQDKRKLTLPPTSGIIFVKKEE